jgi:acyl-CoA thioester hydrolase
MGVVYYANYLVWFEIGRVEVLRTLGLTYGQLEKEHDCILPVVEANCRYRSPARYDDQILIEAWPAILRSFVIKFAYRVWRKEADGAQPTLLAEGETVHVICDSQMKKKILPPHYADALRTMMEKA